MCALRIMVREGLHFSRKRVLSGPVSDRTSLLQSCISKYPEPKQTQANSKS
jgi:hypothetical protein